MGSAFHRRRWLAWAASLAAGCATGVEPAPRSGAAARRESVVIVGAGLAGLACGYRLLQRGHEVLLLEATQRPGGRIHTLREPWADGSFVEAGASHLVSEPALVALLAELGVATEERPRGPELARVRLLGGQRQVFAPGTRPPPEHALSDRERALGEDALMDHYFAAAKSLDPDAAPSAELLALDDLSAAEYLRRQGASPGFLSDIDGMLGVGDRGLEGMSALFLVRSWSQILREMAWGPSRRIAGGFDRLPAELARRLSGRIVYAAPVLAVEHSAAGVSVSFEHAGQRATRAADRVVFAVPPTILARLSITPVLSEEKQRALRELCLESVTRVWLQADRRFWSERGESGRVDSDLPLGPVREEAEGAPGHTGVLGVYGTRAASRRLSALAEPERIQAVLDYVEQAHPGMRQHFTAGASKCWDNEPFQRGAYAWFQPGQLRAFGPELARPEGRCHFCGDYSSQRPGFMHGALASAWRVVAELSA